MTLHWTCSSSSLSFLNRERRETRTGDQNWAQDFRCGLTRAERRARITTLNLLTRVFCGAWGYPSPVTFHLPLLNLIILSTQLSSLSRSGEMAAQPSGVSVTHPSFISPTKFLRVHSIHSSRLLMLINWIRLERSWMRLETSWIRLEQNVMRLDDDQLEL